MKWCLMDINKKSINYFKLEIYYNHSRELEIDE